MIERLKAEVQRLEKRYQDHLGETRRILDGKNSELQRQASEIGQLRNELGTLKQQHFALHEQLNRERYVLPRFSFFL